MPDLSHRPTRYATAAVTAAALLVTAWPSLGVRLRATDELADAKAANAELKAELDKLRAAAAEPLATQPAKPSARSAASAAAVQAAALKRAAAPHSVTLTCATFPDQETAQAAFRAAPRASAALDGDRDGRACEQLKSRAPGIEPAAPPTKPQAATARRTPLRIPSKAALVASGHHFGLATSTREERVQLEYALRRETTMTGYFKGWDTPYDAARVRSAWQSGQVPVMTWESRPLATESTADYPLARIAAGAFDRYLTTYAKQVKAAGMPLVIRFDHEMNGNWYRWSEFESRYGVQVGDYVKAWRHVHDVFRANGANSYVTWLWSPNRIDNLGRYPAIDNYYPGDAYVDWVGMTAYFRPGDRVATFDGTFAKTLAALRRVAPRKPIFLAESGATEDGGQKAAWMRSLWAGVAAQRDVVGLMWFNYAISEAGHTNDWRINSSPEVFSAFRTSLLAQPYGRATGKTPTLIPRLAAYPYALTTPAASPTAAPLPPAALTPAAPPPPPPAAPSPVPVPVASPAQVPSPTASPSGKRKRGKRSLTGSDPAVPPQPQDLVVVATLPEAGRPE